MKDTAKTVVVGIADKQPSALRFAIREAVAMNATLRVVHAAGIPEEPFAGVAVRREIESAARAVLDDAKQFVDDEAPGLDAEFVLAETIPVGALNRAAEGARLLVLGADDVSWYERLLRTRVAGHLALHAPCPVVVVPEVAYPNGSDGDVVVALDGGTSAAGPLRFGFEQADIRGGVLHVVHAVPPATLAADAVEIRANVAEVLAGWREEFPGVSVNDVVSIGDPRDVITRATATARLLIVGRPQNHTLPFALTRPLAMTVLRRANCPLAVVPSEYQGA